jgi:hypothetical protein
MWNHIVAPNGYGVAVAEALRRAKREVAHLALDAPGDLPTTARHDSFFQDFGEHRLMKRFCLPRGE